MGESKTWGIHGGRLGEVDSLFRQNSVVAIGWAPVGDLSALKTRDQFKDRYAKIYRDAKPGSIPTSAGQLFRFVHEAKEGDFIVYPSRQTRRIWIGRIVGPYIFKPDSNTNYPNQRLVEWLKDLPRTHFSQGALYEIGSAMSFFLVKTYAEEFLGSISAPETPTAIATSSDITVGIVSEEIEQSTADFIIKTLSRDLKGIPLEEFVVHLMNRMGYRARRTAANTPSVDIVAHKDELGFEPPVIKVQVKSGDGKVSDRDVSALYGKLSPGEHGLFMALGEFTEEAKRFANSKSNLRLVDGVELVDLILRHYENFDSRFKGILPLKQVYIPEPIEEGE